MVRKDDIVLWFSRQPSHQRLDALCRLASICVLDELRFVNKYVDFLVKKSAPSARDSELLAQYEKICHPLTDIDLHQEDSRRRLIFTLTMLPPTNRPVASSIYRTLYNSCSDWNAFGLDITIETCLELCLIFTMALHHPAFTFEERMSLGKMYSMLSKQYSMWSILEGVSPSTPSPQPQHSPSDDRALVNGSNGSTSSSSSSSGSNYRSKSVQNDRSLRRHRASPKTNGSINAIESITNQLKDLLGDERLPKGWRHFEKHSPSELMACSDQEFHRCGLSASFISHLRKVLSSHSASNHSMNHSSQKTNGLLITANDHTKHHMPLSKSIRPVKTCMGPPNVQPAFNNSQRINEQKQQQQQQQQPPPVVDQSVSRSSSSSGSSSEACSPPSSPTDSSTLAHRVESQRKAFPQPIMMLNTGTRPQGRVPGPNNQATLRGATANFLRPMTGSFPARQQPPVSRAASQPRDLPFVSLPYGQQPQTTPAQSNFMLDSSTPPPHLSEAGPQPVQSPAIFTYLPMPNALGEGAPSYAQPSFTFIPQGPPPGSNAMPGNGRPPGPHEMMYPPTTYVVQSQIIAQPIAHPASNANGRPSMMEMPYLHVMLPQSDYSRPPPAGSAGPSPVPPVSCFNCGSSGHRGPQCQQLTFDEIIKPSPA